MESSKGSCRRDDVAVSTVLGAILMFGIFAVTLVTVQVKYVPLWDRDRETRHMDDLADQMGRLVADASRLSDNATSTPVTNSIRVDAGRGPTMFSGPPGPGSLAVAPAAAGTGIALSSPRLTIQRQGGTTMLGFNETWQHVVTGTSVTNVVGVDHLRLRVNNPTNANDKAAATLTITDAQGAYAGKLRLVNADQSADFNIQVETYGPGSSTQVTSSVAYGFKKQNGPAALYFDALDPNYLFDQILDAARTPYRLDLSTTGLDSDFTLTYEQAASGGSVRVGGTGLVVARYSSLTPSGHLSVDVRNQRYTPQTYTFEHGALLVDQPDGNAMVIGPAFHATSTSTQLAVVLAVPAVQGDPVALSGVDQATVLTSPLGGGVHLEAFAPSLNITLATTHAAAWSTFLDGQLRAAGANAAQYRLETTATTVTLRLYGPTSAPSDLSTNDLFLRLDITPVRDELRPTG